MVDRMLNMPEMMFSDQKAAAGLHDLLASLNKSVCMYSDLNNDDWPAVADNIILKPLLATKGGAKVTLKDFLLAKAERPTQTIEEILNSLNPDKLDTIKKHDLLSNLLAAHLSFKCSLNDIATVMTVYSLYLEAEKNPGLKIEVVEFINHATGDINLLSKLAIKTIFESPCSMDGSRNIDSRISVDKLHLSIHSVLNKVLRVRGDINASFPHNLSRYGLAFLNHDPDAGEDGYANEEKAPILYFDLIPFGIVTQLFKQYTYGKDYALVPFPVFGCADMDIRADLKFNKERTYCALHLPCYLAPELAKMFYGVTNVDSDQLYNNSSGYKDTTIYDPEGVGGLPEISELSLYLCDLFQAGQQMINNQIWRLDKITAQQIYSVLCGLQNTASPGPGRAEIMRNKLHVLENSMYGQDDGLLDALAAYRNSPSQSTGYVLLGRINLMHDRKFLEEQHLKLEEEAAADMELVVINGDALPDPASIQSPNQVATGWRPNQCVMC
jgi:hypothetical protein